MVMGYGDSIIIISQFENHVNALISQIENINIMQLAKILNLVYNLNEVIKMNNIAEKLKELRLEKNLRQEDVAKILNIQKNSYNQYENSKRNIDIDSLIKLADFYKVSLDYITGRLKI